MKFKEYKQLNGKTKMLPEKVGSGILRRFDRTPFPEKPTDVVCPHFMLLAWANGCPYNCAWCFLKGTFRFSPQKPNGRIPMIFKDRERIGREVDSFVQSKCLPEILNTGELADSLMDEQRTDLRLPFSEWLIRKLQGTKHKALFLTKSTNTKEFLQHDWTENAILSWTVNAPKVSARWEMYAPGPMERLKAAREARRAGYEVRLRIDPMVPIEGWQDDYALLLTQIFNGLLPNRITLGTLRGLTTTLLYCKDKSWTVYLTEKSNWGKKSAFDIRAEMYAFVLNWIETNVGTVNVDGGIEVGICKETLAMHEALQMKPANIRCNCIP